MSRPSRARIRIGLLSCLALAVMTPSLAAPQPSGRASTPGGESAEPAQVTLPLSVRLVTPAGEPLVAGRLAPNLKVAIRNTTPLAARQGVAMPLQAFVLRGVHWVHERDDDRQWLKRLPGQAEMSPNGMVDHRASEGGVTALAFETGLLLPGEELTVAAPMTPQPGGKHELVVRYAVIADGKDWMGEVLLVAELPRYPGAWYRPATPKLVAARPGVSVEGSVESSAIVRSTSTPGAPLLKIQTKVFPVQIPLSQR